MLRVVTSKKPTPFFLKKTFFLKHQPKKRCKKLFLLFFLQNILILINLRPVNAFLVISMQHKCHMTVSNRLLVQKYMHILFLIYIFHVMLKLNCLLYLSLIYYRLNNY